MEPLLPLLRQRMALTMPPTRKAVTSPTSRRKLPNPILSTPAAWITSAIAA